MRGPVCGVPSHLILCYLPGDHLEYFEDKVKHLRSFHRSYRQGVPPLAGPMTYAL
jgi:hypothetical protein